MTDLHTSAETSRSRVSSPLLTRPVRAVVVSICYAILFYGFDQIAVHSQSGNAVGVSHWYAPAGLSIAVLLRFGIGYAPVYFLLCLISNAYVWRDFHPSGLASDVALASAPVLIYTVTAWLLRRQIRLDHELRKLRSVVIFISAMITASAVVAITHASLQYAFGSVPWIGLSGYILDFWIGDIIAHLSVAPILLTICFPWASNVIIFFRQGDAGRRIGPVLRRLLPRVATTLVWFGFLATIIYFSFARQAPEVNPALYPCFVPLILAAFWRGIKGAATGVFFVCAGTSLFATAVYAHHGPDEIQLFLIALSLTSLLLGAAMTESRRSAQDLAAVHDFYRQAITAARGVPYVRDYQNDTFAYIGEGIERVTGFTAAEFTPDLWEVRSRVTQMHGEAEDMQIQEAIRRTRAGEFKTWSSEGRFLARDGSTRWVLDASVEILGSDGLPVRSIGLIQDISVYKQTELALRESEQQRALILSALPVCFYTGQIEETFNVTWISESVESLTGYPAAEFLGQSTLWFDRIHEEDSEDVARKFGKLLSTGIAAAEYRWLRKDGTYRWFWNQVVVTLAETGRFTQVVGIWLDITERKRAEEVLQKSRAVLYSFVEHTPAAVAMLDRDLCYIAVSRRWLLDYRLGKDDIIGKCHYDVFPEIRKNQDWLDIHQRALGGSIERRDEDYFAREDGNDDWLRWEVRPWYAEDDTIGGIMMFTEVITERKRAEVALRESQDRLDLALSGADLGLWDLDIPAGKLEVSERWAQIFGFTLQDVPREAAEWYARAHDDDKDPSVNHFWSHIAGEIPMLDIEVRFRSRTNEWVWVHLRGKIGERDSDGVPIRIAGTLLDISARKAAESDRQALEAQMQHTQKLESLGVLAGGIAHDFNNLLVGILGNADLALMDLPPGSPVRESLEDIVVSAQRAAELCKQMLAYSGRGRFVVAPVSMNELIREMNNLLAVSISKRVTMKFEPMPNIPLVHADATQIRQIVMNLLTNASEAIGDAEGEIHISTSVITWTRAEVKGTLVGCELEPGIPYVCMRIADTGVGMNDATLARVFDPFFTTKFTGRGLGMAAVLGIVRGHDGAIRVESEPGVGTTFEVLLPALQAKVEAPAPEAPKPSEVHGSGLVLVVDDEQPVLDIASAMLHRRGFSVITAHDGREALQVFESRKDEVILAIVDLTMPRMSGGDLLMELQRLKPGLRVVLSSGYNEQEAVAQTHGEKMAEFIQKPYRAIDFYAMLQRVLEKESKIT